MATALLSLGSNVGDRAAALRQSLELLAHSPALRVTATSSFCETRPAGGPAAQENFLNAAAVLETSLPPRELLSVLQAVENQLGRVRDQRWGPRTIDLDLLLYDQVELETPELTLPHPRMSFRRFVLEPAAEIAAEMVHPVCGNTIAGLLRHLDQSPRYLAILGLKPLVSTLRPVPRLVIAPDSPLSPWADTSGTLLSAIQRLEHDEWLIATQWMPAGTRLQLDGNSRESSLGNSMPALVQPKLLIVIPYDSDVRDLVRGIAQSFRGPMLWLQDCSADQLRDEVLAAIQAME